MSKEHSAVNVWEKYKQREFLESMEDRTAREGEAVGLCAQSCSINICWLIREGVHFFRDYRDKMSSLADDERNAFLTVQSSWELANDNLCINDNKRNKNWQKQKAHRHLEHQMTHYISGPAAPVLPTGQSPACLSPQRDVWTQKKPRSNNLAPGTSVVSDLQWTGQQMCRSFFKIPGLARVRSLSAWPGLCLQLIDSAADAGSAH